MAHIVPGRYLLGPFWPGPVFEECNKAQAQPGPIFWDKKLALLRPEKNRPNPPLFQFHESGIDVQSQSEEHIRVDVNPPNYIDIVLTEEDLPTYDEITTKEE